MSTVVCPTCGTARETRATGRVAIVCRSCGARWRAGHAPSAPPGTPREAKDDDEGPSGGPTDPPEAPEGTQGPGKATDPHPAPTTHPHPVEGQDKPRGGTRPVVQRAKLRIQPPPEPAGAPDTKPGPLAPPGQARSKAAGRRGGVAYYRRFAGR